MRGILFVFLPVPRNQYCLQPKAGAGALMAEKKHIYCTTNERRNYILYELKGRKLSVNDMDKMERDRRFEVTRRSSG